MSEVLLEADTRGRISVSKLTDERRFLAHTDPDGTVVLTPAVVMSSHQAALLARPNIMASIRDGLDDRSKLRTRRLPPVPEQ